MTKQVYIYYIQIEWITKEFKMNTLKYVFAPYAVLAEWGDVQWHFAWTRREAMEWVACYPKTGAIVVKVPRLRSYLKFSDMIAARF
jgi:hypothetical protein